MPRSVKTTSSPSKTHVVRVETKPQERKAFFLCDFCGKESSLSAQIRNSEKMRAEYTCQKCGRGKNIYDHCERNTITIPEKALGQAEGDFYDRLQVEESRETNNLLLWNTILTGVGSCAGLVGTLLAIYLILR